MKKLISMLLVGILLILSIPTSVQAKVHHEEMRAVWISTVYNIDYPSTASINNKEMQQREYIQLLDRLQAIGINTVFVQVRPKADAFYKSAINPWSDILTGVQGKDPGYDPMTFMIEETHRRGMSFHAWLNPYRVTTSGTDLNVLAPSHPARLHPEWVLTHDNKVYYNPALPEVQQHIVDTATEIVANYDVDGIHFDDYFYPANYPLPVGEGKDGLVANSRREDINTMIHKVSRAIERTNPNVQFGISPIGIWKNQKSDWRGSNTDGGEGYYSVCADAKTWIENEWIDYIIPQIYWEIGHKKADYATLVKWWSDLVKGTDVKLYIGQGIYKDIIAEQIDKQLLENKKYEQIEGNAYFSAKDLINNRKGVADKLTTIYKNSDIEIELPPVKPIEPVEPVEPEVPSVPEGSTYKIGITTVDKLNVRSGQGTTYPVTTQLPKGTKVDIISTNNGWHQVRLASGQTGYVSSNYIELSKEIRLIINGKQVRPSVPPILKEGTTLVPLRIISENLGATVNWDPIKKEVTILKGNDKVQVTIGNTTVYANGSAEVLAIPPVLVEGTTMVPIRFIGENLGATVEWDSLEKIVKVINH